MTEGEAGTEGETGTEGEAGAARFPLRVSPAATMVVATVLVVALAAALGFGVLLLRKASNEGAESAALATARAYAVTTTSYNYLNLDHDFASVLDGATGEFRTEYASAAEPLRQVLTATKASASGTVVAAGVQSGDASQVVVVLLVNQTVSNASSPTPKVARDRLVMTLTPSGGRWLVSRMELL